MEHISSRLSARERAALAEISLSLQADDPSFVKRLEGTSRSRSHRWFRATLIGLAHGLVACGLLLALVPLSGFYEWLPPTPR